MEDTAKFGVITNTRDTRSWQEILKQRNLVGLMLDSFKLNYEMWIFHIEVIETCNGGENTTNPLISLYFTSPNDIFWFCFQPEMCN